MYNTSLHMLAYRKAGKDGINNILNNSPLPIQEFYIPVKKDFSRLSWIDLSQKLSLTNPYLNPLMTANNAKPLSPLTAKVVAYSVIPNYDMNECVDWAFQMVELGYDSENLVILAGLSKPTNYFEAGKYVASALNELNLVALTGDSAIVSYASYYVAKIASAELVKRNIAMLSSTCIELGYPTSIFDFYLLHFAWGDLDAGYVVQSHWDGATSENIEQLAIEEAHNWVSTKVS